MGGRTRQQGRELTGPLGPKLSQNMLCFSSVRGSVHTLHLEYVEIEGPEIFPEILEVFSTYFRNISEDADNPEIFPEILEIFHNFSEISEIFLKFPEIFPGLQPLL